MTENLLLKIKKYINCFAIILLLVLFFIPKNTITESSTEELLKDLNHEIESEMSGNKTDIGLSELLELRREKLKAYIKDNPEKAQEYYFENDIKGNIPSSFVDIVESDKTISGDIIRLEIDYADGKSDYDYKLSYNENGEERMADLFLSDKSVDVYSLEDVSVSGTYLDGYFLSSKEQIHPQKNHVQDVNPLNVAGDSNVLVIRANFQDNPTDQPYTTIAVQDALFNDVNSTNNYFQETSYGAYAMSSGDVTNWLTLPNDSNEDCEENYLEWSFNADDLAESSGYNLANYDRVLYLIASTGCPMAGIATLPGDWSMYFDYNDSRVYTHEIGHNIGLHHASNYDCDDLTIDNYSNCNLNEYGDYYDTMGYHWSVTKPQQYNSAFKTSLGWLSGSRILEVSTSGRYTINYLEDYNVGIQALKIKKEDTGDYYYLDYRKPTGFDSALTTWGYTQSGVMAHIWDDAQYSKSYLIDFQPVSGSVPSTDFKNTTLLDGTSFTDSANGITIGQVSHNSNTVTIDVTFTNYTVTASAGANGSISPAGLTTVSLGGSQTYNISPNSGYLINDVLIDGESAGAISSYTFTNVSSNHTISATFRLPVFSYFNPGAGNETMLAFLNGPKTFTVNAYNELDSRVNGYSGIASFVSSDNTAILPIDNGSGWSASGYKNFTVTFKSLGPQTIMITDTNTGESSTFNFYVSLGSLHHIDVSPATSQSISLGQNIQFSAQGKDVYNNDLSISSFNWTNASSSGLFTGSNSGSFGVVASANGVNSPTITVNVGKNAFTAAKVYETPNYWYSVPSSKFMVSGDFNNDDNLDLAAMYDRGGNSMAILFFPGNGDGTYGQYQCWFKSGLGTWSVGSTKQLVAGDFDKDGIDDLVAMYDYEYSKMGLWSFK